MDRRFILPSYVAISAETEEEAARLAEDFFPTEDWKEVGEGVAIYDPGWPPCDVIEDEDESGPACICPPDLVARGGFKGSCRAEHPAAGVS